jgi:hypothetical protein
MTVQVQGSPLAETIYRRAVGFSVSRAKCSRSTTHLQAQLSIAYATGETPFERRHFMSNERPDV